MRNVEAGKNVLRRQNELKKHTYLIKFISHYYNREHVSDYLERKSVLNLLSPPDRCYNRQLIL